MTDNAPSESSAPKGNDFGRFVSRLGKAIARPEAFWQDIKRSTPPLGEVVFPHIVVLVGARSVSLFLGALFAGQGFGTALGQLFTSFITCFAFVWAFAFAAVTIASARGGRPSLNEGVVFAAYAAIPMLLVSVLGLVPLPIVVRIADMLAMPVSFYVLSLGVRELLGVAEAKLPSAVALLCGAVLVLWGLMPSLMSDVISRLGG